MACCHFLSYWRMALLATAVTYLKQVFTVGFLVNLLMGFLATLLTDFLVHPLASFLTGFLVRGWASVLVDLMRGFLSHLLKGFCANLFLGQGEARNLLLGRRRGFLLRLSLSLMGVSTYCGLGFLRMGFTEDLRRFFSGLRFC
jgi:hypothetical protein